MIYKGLNRTGEIETVKAHGGADIAEVYGGINESNPIYYKTRTITGQTPLSYKALSKPLSDYLISGNTVQNGTPTPEAPVEVLGCGVKTRNLFDYKTAYARYLSGDDIIITPAQMVSGKQYFKVSEVGKTITMSVFAKAVTSTRVFITARVGGKDIESNSVPRGNSGTLTITITPTSTSDFFNLSYGDGGQLNTFNKFMLNEGSTSLPYEPYGYKLPLTVNGTEYPIYLGQVETTRRIKKLILTGEEAWQLWSSGQTDVERYYYKWGKTAPSDYGLICTHLPFRKWDGNFEHIRLGGNYSDDFIVFISRTIAPTVADFKSYLAAQYAAGTPVTVWYVLAEPETGIVNEPLHKIGDYADTVSMAQAGVTIPTVAGTNTLLVDTTVQPSALSITGHVKPVST